MLIKAYVITHKEQKMPVPVGFEPLLVGAQNHPEITCYKNRDNEGDNISAKNKNYCELTGIYWMWKNIKADVVGLCHYRRFFSKASFGVRIEEYLDTDTIEKIMTDYDVIVPVRHYYEKSVIESETIAPDEADMAELSRAIDTVSPDYKDVYDEFIHDNKVYFYNMCIMKKELFDSYCEWLFSVLSFIEKDYDISDKDEYRARIYGFISERLLKVWLMKNVEPSKIHEMRVVFSDNTALGKKKSELNNEFRNIKWSIRKAFRRINNKNAKK